jgi:hypothetical protein
MRDRILQGPLFTNQERADILDYCESDVDALARGRCARCSNLSGWASFTV